MWQERFIAVQRPLQTTAQCRLVFNENVSVKEAKQACFRAEVASPETIPERHLTSFSIETIQSAKKKGKKMHFFRKSQDSNFRSGEKDIPLGSSCHLQAMNVWGYLYSSPQEAQAFDGHPTKLRWFWLRTDLGCRTLLITDKRCVSSELLKLCFFTARNIKDIPCTSWLRNILELFQHLTKCVNMYNQILQILTFFIVEISTRNTH